MKYSCVGYKRKGFVSKAGKQCDFVQLFLVVPFRAPALNACGGSYVKTFDVPGSMGFDVVSVFDNPAYSGGALDVEVDFNEKGRCVRCSVCDSTFFANLSCTGG